ncbi:MAG: hypothetical protein JNM30_00875 [Rhodospirillales bacterium]|nr:hypothetical protein [Rhodospirillales bacterium]
MRALGWLLIALAGLALALDALGWPASEPPAAAYPLSALDALWTRLSPASLAWTRAMIEQHVTPGLWQNAILPVLRLPGVLVFALPGLLLLALADLGDRYGIGGTMEGTAAARRRHRRKGGLRE